MKELETMHQLAAALDNSKFFHTFSTFHQLMPYEDGMEKVVCIQAKVRIVKVWDPEFKLSADLNVNNTLALENTRMIKLYVQLDDRVRQLVMIIKHWTKQRLLNDAGKKTITASVSAATNRIQELAVH
jgi:DNA polymerase sigma